MSVMTLNTTPSPAFDLSQFDSESEDYDQLPPAPLAAALLIGMALFAAPVVIASLVIVPAAIAGRVIAERLSR